MSVLALHTRQLLFISISATCRLLCAGVCIYITSVSSELHIPCHPHITIHMRHTPGVTRLSHSLVVCAWLAPDSVTWPLECWAMCLEVGQIWLPALGASQGGSLAEGPSRDGEWSLSVHRAPAGVSDLTPAGGIAPVCGCVQTRSSWSCWAAGGGGAQAPGPQWEAGPRGSGLCGGCVEWARCGPVVWVSPCTPVWEASVHSGSLGPWCPRGLRCCFAGPVPVWASWLPQCGCPGRPPIMGTPVWAEGRELWPHPRVAFSVRCGLNT